jgi:hypothetical protein
MIFEFNWTWYEDYTPYLFEHSNKTKDEFADDCRKAMKECFDNYMEEMQKQSFRWAQVPYWMEMACKKLEEYGYKPIRPVVFGYFGGYLIKDDYDTKEDENLLKDFPEQVEKMKQHNIKVDERGKEKRKKIIEKEEKSG